MNGNSAPNAGESAMTQFAFNQMAAKEQQKLNMVGQTTPYGSLNWIADPNSPGGYRAVQKLSPELQKLLGSNIGMAQGSSNIGNALLRNAGSAMSKPLDLSYGANAERIAGLEQKSLDPLWAKRTEDFNQTMANRGLVPGSAAYEAASRDFNTSKDSAYDNMFLSAWDKANSAAVQQYNSPFNALASLRTGSQLQQPVSSLGLTQTPQESIQAPNYMQAQQAQYAAQNASNNAMMGGLFGLGGNLLGMMML